MAGGTQLIQPAKESVFLWIALLGIVFLLFALKHLSIFLNHLAVRQIVHVSRKTRSSSWKSLRGNLAAHSTAIFTRVACACKKGVLGLAARSTVFSRGAIHGVRQTTELVSKKLLYYGSRGIRDYRCLVLALLILFHVGGNIYVVSNGDPVYGDASFFLDYSMQMHRHLREGRIGQALTVVERYGPFYFYLTQPFYFLFGMNPLSASLPNDVFFGILIVGAFFVGRELLSDTAGLLSAFLVSFYPQVYGLSRIYILDFALTALVCVDLYLLLRTRGLTENAASVLLGISLGVSALIKPQFILFLAGPLAAVFLSGFRLKQSDSTARRKAGNLLRIIVISLLIYSPWFLPRPEFILGDAKRSILENFGGKRYLHQPWSLQDVLYWPHVQNVLHWPRVMMGYQFLYVLGAPFVAAAGWLVFTRAVPKRAKHMLISFLLVPFFFFTFIVLYNKDPRFILPLTVGISLISALFLASIRQTMLRRILIALVVLVGLGQYVVLSSSAEDFCANRERFIPPYFSAVDPTNQESWNFGVFRPSPEPPGLKEAAAFLIEETEKLGRQPMVIGTRTPLQPLHYLRHPEKGLSFDFGSPDRTYFPPYNRAVDYVLLLGMPPEGEHCTSYREVGENESIRLFEERRGNYTLVASFPFFPCATTCSPGKNHTIEIFKRIP